MKSLGLLGVQGCAVLLYALGDESVDLLQVPVDLPVRARKVL